MNDLLIGVEVNMKLCPQQDSPQCHAGGCSEGDQIPTTLTDNMNKILVLDPDSRDLIVCGTILQGACRKYHSENISAPAHSIPMAIAANDEGASTYAFIGPEKYNQWSKSNVLYVGTTFTNMGDYRHDVPAISSRSLSGLDIKENSFKQPLLRIDVKYRDHFLVKYVYGFNSSDFAYFVLVQKQSHLPGQEEMGYVTRIARVCISDSNYDSYTEVTLQCMVNENESYEPVVYNITQDAKIIIPGSELATNLGIEPNKPILVATFSPSKGITNEPVGRSAVCLYTLQDIDNKFDENIHMCFNGSIKYRNMPYISGPVLDGNCPEAGSTGNILNFCEVGLKISGVSPMVATSIINYPNHLVTSVTLAVTEKNTVIFLGTSNGILKKVLISSNMNQVVGIEYEQMTLDKGNTILPDTQVHNDHIYLLTTRNVLKLPVEHCSSYSNCTMCLDSKDPYCGWCSLEKKCTIRNACKKANQSSPRWLSLGTGQQCIDFEQIIPDRIPINQNSLVHLTIRTLPELPYGAKYKCVFGNSEPIDATLSASGLTCATPSINNRPYIPENQDHIYVPISVRSSETNKDFVSRNFAFYDCSYHTKCTDCIRSQWACNWCVYENKCTHNISTCQRVVISGENNPIKLALHGAKECPRIKKPKEPILLPNNIPKEITLEVDNLPHPQVGHTGFQCIVNIEGANMVLPARMESSRFIVCDRTTYTYEANSGEYEATVSMVWNRNHHVDTIGITLYKCDILGSHREHPDCSLCITRHAKYQCTWCVNTCSYKETCSQMTNECPKPRIDLIKPLSGPIEGGTMVTIEGSNLGLKEEDVRGKIHIGETYCQLVDYEISVKIICRTEPSNVEKIAPVFVSNNIGYTESAVQFSFKSIVLKDVIPALGPVSGGTVLSITGENLNIGSHIKVYLDELVCHVNITQSSSRRITCVTTRSIVPRTVNKLIVSIDGANRTLLNEPFIYKSDPTISEIKPSISFASGGRLIRVHGTNFDTIQKPEMFVFVDTPSKIINKTTCNVLDPAQMECPSPSITEFFRKFPRRRKRNAHKKNHVKLKIGFVMDNVDSVTDLEKYKQGDPSRLVYVEDPRYLVFVNNVKYYNGDNLVIEGENLNTASDESDIRVTIGTELCNITSLSSNQLSCIPPMTQPVGTDHNGSNTPNGLPLVMVHVGQIIKYRIGYLRYEMLSPYTSLPSEAVAGIAMGSICLLIVFVIILFVYRHKSTRAEREYKRIQIQMDTLESNVRLECKQAFAELQTDMTDLTADLENTGIPTLNHNEYILKVFFPGVKDHPILINDKSRMNQINNYDNAMYQFEQLINNKHFLILFIETLENQKTFNIRDKVNVASLLMIILMNKMQYSTEILKILLLKLIEKSVSTKHPQLMLRRTESVVEKMLTNWMSLCMYKYLKDCSGSSLFLLYKAIKYQIEKGPVDYYTHEARYSLSEEKLLRENVDFCSVNLRIVQEDGRYEKIPYQTTYHTLHVMQEEVLEEKMQCKVLSCDTISQVKSKILDALYKNTPHSMRPNIHEIDLEWRHGRGGHLILNDEDLTTKNVYGWKKVNTLSHYGVKDNAIMCLIHKQSYNHTMSYPHKSIPNCNVSSYFNPIPYAKPLANGNLDTGDNVFHLVKPIEDQNFNSNSKPERMHKTIPEIFLTRLLSTKGIVQKFVDDFFNTILTVNENLPISIKWLFDLFDESARRHNISDAEIVHAWKSNSLPMRFWINFIKNPDFIFDIHKTPTVDSSLSVIAQTFMDSCSTSDHRLGKDSPSNKLLFAKDIHKYRDIVRRFYANIQSLPPVGDEDLNVFMSELSRSHEGHFNTVSALKELYIYVNKYHEQILTALDTDPHCSKLHLAHKLENVFCTLDGEQTSAC
ncbi:hypothetical protein M8J75_000766 [Diaphorina citri]|nr:hypothetical protein M8J75_000766 [Diaphorina citri]